MKPPAISHQTSKRLGWVLLVLGTVTTASCLTLMVNARAGAVAERHTWSDGPIYLTSTVRGGEHRCTVTPDHGDARRITVPAMPNRGPQIAGRRLDP